MKVPNQLFLSLHMLWIKRNAYYVVQCFHLKNIKKSDWTAYHCFKKYKCVPQIVGTTAPVSNYRIRKKKFLKKNFFLKKIRYLVSILLTSLTTKVSEQM